jgi:hypothetical protein
MRGTGMKNNKDGFDLWWQEKPLDSPLISRDPCGDNGLAARGNGATTIKSTRQCVIARACI